MRRLKGRGGRGDDIVARNKPYSPAARAKVFPGIVTSEGRSQSEILSSLNLPEKWPPQSRV